jgi:hypothetical protein
LLAPSVIVVEWRLVEGVKHRVHFFCPYRRGGLKGLPAQTLALQFTVVRQYFA